MPFPRFANQKRRNRQTRTKRGLNHPNSFNRNHSFQIAFAAKRSPKSLQPPIVPAGDQGIPFRFFLMLCSVFASANHATSLTNRQ
jgi:hypothetical protein